MPRRRRRVDAGGSLRAFLAGEQRNLYGIIDGLYRTAGRSKAAALFAYTATTCLTITLSGARVSRATT